MTQHSFAFLQELWRNDFETFLHKSFLDLHPGQKFISNWHIDALAHELMLVEMGRTNRLIITMPPRHLKSLSTSVIFPAWLLGKNPSKKILCASYSQDLASTHTSSFRRLCATEDYRSTFPALRFEGGKNTSTEQSTSENGFRYATSVGGTLTGRGGDLIIIDDPIKTDAAMSDVERLSVKTWFNQTVSTRLNQPSEGAIIVVMQRLHEDDLVGHLLENDPKGWKHLDIPAIAQESKIYVTGFDAHNRHITKPDEVLSPKMMDRDTLIGLRNQVGSQQFSAQYLQQPVPFDGTIIKRKWISYYDNLPAKDDTHAVIQSWDTAYETGKSNDYSVCTTWVVSPKGLFLKDVYREKLEFPQLLMKATELANRHKANIVLIEATGSGAPLQQTLKGSLSAKLIAISPVSDKQTRLTSVSHMFENGAVLIPKEAEWKELYVKELTAFPSSKHDDQVDSTSQFLKIIAGKTIDRFRFASDGKQMQIRPTGRGPDGKVKSQPKYTSLGIKSNENAD